MLCERVVKLYDEHLLQTNVDRSCEPGRLRRPTAPSRTSCFDCQTVYCQDLQKGPLEASQEQLDVVLPALVLSEDELKAEQDKLAMQESKLSSPAEDP